MAVYAIGDLQGCYDPLRRLLDRLAFDPAHDQVWLVGDLINRGPDSLATLRFIRDLGASAISVLGNHDLTLLVAAEGFIKPKRRDTFQSILAAPDREELLHWLRHRPLLHYDAALHTVMVHAGIAPQWSLEQAQMLAHEFETALQGADAHALLRQLFGSEPRRWQDNLTGIDRLRAIVNYFTRMRFCTPDGTLDFDHKGPPGSQPRGLLPWYEVPQRQATAVRIVVGHWASLDYVQTPHLVALDTGCVWGRMLTALRLDAPSTPCCVDCAGMAS